MPDALDIALCPKLCQHNPANPRAGTILKPVKKTLAAAFYTTGEGFHSNFSFSQTFTSVTITLWKHRKNVFYCGFYGKYAIFYVSVVMINGFEPIRARLYLVYLVYFIQLDSNISEQVIGNCTVRISRNTSGV